MSDWKTNRRAAGKAAGEARWNAQVDLINLDETARQLGYALADKYGFGAGSEEGLLLAGYAVDAVEGYDLGENISKHGADTSGKCTNSKLFSIFPIIQHTSPFFKNIGWSILVFKDSINCSLF